MGKQERLPISDLHDSFTHKQAKFMNNNEIVDAKLKQIKAQTQALIEQIDLNPTIDECVELIMAEQLIQLSLQVQHRMHELRMSPETLNLKASVSKLELTSLLTCKRLPSLRALCSIANALHCDLRLNAEPTAQSAGMRVLISIRPNFSENDVKENLALLLKSSRLIVETKLGGAYILSCFDEPLDSFFSTRFLFRSLVSRMYTLKLELQATLESVEYHATVI